MCAIMLVIRTFLVFFYHHHESIQLDIKSCGNDMINPQLLNNNPKTRHKIITAQ